LKRRSSAIKVQHYQVALKIGFIVNDVRAE
jgi:flavin-binding protein dodecin